MKLTSAIVVIGLSMPASAFALTPKEEEFVTDVLVSGLVFDECPDYRAGPVTVEAWGQRNGVDAPRIMAAITAVMSESSDEPYKSSDLIPDVTTFVVALSISLAGEHDEQGPAEFCRRRGAFLVDAGLAKGK